MMMRQGHQAHQGGGGSSCTGDDWTVWDSAICRGLFPPSPLPAQPPGSPEKTQEQEPSEEPQQQQQPCVGGINSAEFRRELMAIVSKLRYGPHRLTLPGRLPSIRALSSLLCPILPLYLAAPPLSPSSLSSLAPASRKGQSGMWKLICYSWEVIKKRGFTSLLMPVFLMLKNTPSPSLSLCDD